MSSSYRPGSMIRPIKKQNQDKTQTQDKTKTQTQDKTQSQTTTTNPILPQSAPQLSLGSSRNNPRTNKSDVFTTNLFKSNYEQSNPKYSECMALLRKGCCYIPNFFGRPNNNGIFDSLKSEIESKCIDDDDNDEVEANGERIRWSKHFKIENPQNSYTFNQIVKELTDHFRIEVSQTRLNYYSNGQDWKPFHHDSHAYGDKRENYTIGASFGSRRDIVFVHKDEENLKFSFPQNNGDVFAFDYDTNVNFKHGIPKANRPGERFSIIIWGKI